MKSLSSTSRKLSWGVILLWLLTLPIAVLRWSAANPWSWLPPTLAAGTAGAPLSAGVRLACFVVEMIPLAAALYAMLALRRICQAYIRGEIFRHETGAEYRRFGRGLLLLGGANALYTSLLSTILSAATGGGKLALSLGLSTADLYLLIVGGAVQLLGIVMDEAYRIHDENSQII